MPTRNGKIKNRKTYKTNHASNKYSRKKRTIRKSRNRKSKKNRMLGGEFIGCGSSGFLYARPRLPCAADKHNQAETLADVSRPEEMTQVGKLFKNEIDIKINPDTGADERHRRNYSIEANTEMETINRLREHLPVEVTDDMLNQYFILPIKQCQINRNELNQPPYNTPEWKQCKSGRYNKRVFKEDGTALPPILNTMVVSKLGGSDINNILKNTPANPITDLQLMYNLNNLTNVLRGIHLLQQYDFIYGDLKAINIINIDGVFKLGDVGDIRHIPTTDDMGAMPFAFQYHIWPTISLYSYFFDKKEMPTPDVPTHIKLARNNPRSNAQNTELSLVYNLYNRNEDFNNNSIRYFLNPYLVEPFIITEDLGFTSEQVITATAYKDTLLGEKLLYYAGFQVRSNSASNFINALDHNDTASVNYVKDLDNIMVSFSTVAELKLDLLKRIDIYSIGMLLLTCVGEHIKYKKNITDGINKRVISPDVIMRLYDLIFECCAQGRRCPDIFDIMTKYIQITRDYMTAYSAVQPGNVGNRVISHSLNDNSELVAPAIRDVANIWGANRATNNNNNGW